MLFLAPEGYHVNLSKYGFPADGSYFSLKVRYNETCVLAGGVHGGCGVTLTYGDESQWCVTGRKGEWFSLKNKATGEYLHADGGKYSPCVT